MPPPKRTSTTRLPAALREQLEKEVGQNTRRRPNAAVSRKEARKQGRQQQRQRKAEFFARQKPTDLQPDRKRSADKHQGDEPVRKKPRRASEPTSTELAGTDAWDAGRAAPKSERTALKEQISPRITVGSKVVSNPSTRKSTINVVPHNLGQGDAEDARIAWLEAKLRTDKSKSGKKSTYFGDGLDELMDDLDRIIPTTRQPLAGPPESEEKEDSEISEFEGFSAAGEEDDAEAQDSSSQVAPEEAGSGVMGLDDKVTATPSVSIVPTVSRYIPPHLRQRPTDDSETIYKLSRQMKGLLNRLSEQNMASIMGSIEELYRNNRRNDVSSTLTNLMIDGISLHSSLSDSFVILHACLVASLYKIIGVDFGTAGFVQSLIASYEQHYQALRAIDSPQSLGEDSGGKECLNLVVLLSELYNFQVVSCVLVYDIIRGLLDNLDEFDVELLLKIVRNSGQQLRQDDPSALKDIIRAVQIKTAHKEQTTISSRTHFMIETLTNLKNNKVKRVQHGHSESAERMKKFLSGLNRKYHVTAHDPLRVTLDDLHTSDKKGKWWLVGSAWGGDPLVDRAHADDQQPATKDPQTQPADSLLKLARKQGMNTDVRRNVFVVLMSSDDYVDACERLSQLNLTEVQQREIVRVILHCLGNEKLYNPYYTLIVQQLCQTSHSHKVTLQFCLWDLLRDLGEKNVGGAETLKNVRDDDPHITSDRKIAPTRLANVARAYAWWIARGCSSLTILKPVDFTVLHAQSHDFFRTLFLQLFISSQVSSPVIATNAGAAEHLPGTRNRESLEKIFIKAASVPALTQGLLHFLTTALRGEDGTGDKAVSDTLKWAREVAKETLRTGMDVVTSLT